MAGNLILCAISRFGSPFRARCLLFHLSDARSSSDHAPSNAIFAKRAKTFKKWVLQECPERRLYPTQSVIEIWSSKRLKNGKKFDSVDFL